MEFALPLGFWGLLSLPALLCVYFFIGRAKPYVVSSLFLWTQQKRLPKSGLRLNRLQTPLTLFLELLILALLTLAAAGPRIPASHRNIPLVAVLDDSFSMTAGNGETPKSRAQQDLRNLIEREGLAPVRVVLAGVVPEVLDGLEFGESQLTSWSCMQPEADMTAAIGLARELAGARALILAVSDRAPEFSLETGSLQWRAYGEPISNLAFVNAGRSKISGEDRCTVEIGNFSTRSQKVKVTVESGDKQGLSLELEPGEHRRLQFRPPNRDTPVTVLLPDDGLDLDNRVWLVQESPIPVRVKLRISDRNLLDAVSQALDAAGEWERVDGNPELAVLDGDPEEVPGLDPETWLLQFPNLERGNPLIGPFVVDTGHPLADGLALNGVVWATDPNWVPGGQPVIGAGNLALLSEIDSGKPRVYGLNYTLAGGSIHRSPNWPVLFWNLLRFRAGARPGVNEPNHRLGTPLELGQPSRNGLTIAGPGGLRKAFTATGADIFWTPEVPGLYRIEDYSQSFAVNACSSTESDLSGAVSGTWGQWSPSFALERSFTDLGPVLLVLALLFFSLHWLWLRHLQGRPTP